MEKQVTRVSNKMDGNLFCSLFQLLHSVKEDHAVFPFSQLSKDAQSARKISHLLKKKCNDMEKD